MRVLGATLHGGLVVTYVDCGQDHFEVSRVLTNLGHVYGRLGDKSKAKELFERVLKTQIKHFGQDHFETAITLTNLGNVYINLGDYDKAKEVIERVVVINLKHLGEDHIKVAMIFFYLAMTHGLLDKHEKAAEMLGCVLLVYEDHFGAHHGRCNDVRRAFDGTTRSKRFVRFPMLRRLPHFLHATLR